MQKLLCVSTHYQATIEAIKGLYRGYMGLYRGYMGIVDKHAEQAACQLCEGPSS